MYHNGTPILGTAHELHLNAGLLVPHSTTLHWLAAARRPPQAQGFRFMTQALGLRPSNSKASSGNIPHTGL